MDERELRTMIGEVKGGRLSRRHFVQTMIGLGLTAPMAAQMLASAGVAQAQSKLAYKPTKRGGGGPLKTLWWQGATLLNPHFATGTKDQDGSRIFYEPLASWDPDGNLAPILATEIPTMQNGGLSKDGKSVTWQLKKNVVLARRQALHRRRLRVHVGVLRRSGHRVRVDRRPTRTSRSRRSTATPSRSTSPSRRRSGPIRSWACAA